jgi:hypothetical protein
MGIKAGNPESVTIVGGRPMHRAVEAGDLPQGVEQVLTLAGLDPDFRSAVSKDPVAAAAAKGIALDPVEAALLESLPPEAVAAMADRIIIPRTPGRRTFMKAVSASVVAMVTGHAFLLCSGCTGADTFAPDSSPEQRWMNLAGYTCYVCIPSLSEDAGPRPMPVLIALHGDGETCLSSAQRWQAAGEQFGFCLVAINWTQDARLPEERTAMLGKLGTLLEDLRAELGIDTGDVFLSTRGLAADMLLQAGYLGASPVPFKAVNLLGGAPQGDWGNDADALLSSMISSPPGIYCVLGQQDDDYAQGRAFVDALEARGVDVKLEEATGTTDAAVLSFSAIWGWMAA